MKIFREIAGRLFALWAILWFVITMLLFLVPFFIFAYPHKDPVRVRRFIAYSRVWMGIYLRIIGCPLRIRGKENFKANENYVVVCNHNSLMDVPVSSPAIPGTNKTIAKIEMAGIPLFGVLYRTGSVLVDRKSEKSRRDSFEHMKEVLRQGLHMCIYPEGTRNRTDQPLKSFHDGAFRLAISMNKAIIPAVIFNTKQVLPAGKFFYLMPRRLEIHFLPPVYPPANGDVQFFRQEVFDLMSRHYSQGLRGR